MGVEVRGERLWRDGSPWFPVGVNYHPSSVGVRWLRSWRPDEIAADLDQMAQADLDCVRVFAYWADLEPALGRHEPAVLDRLERFAAMAHDRGIAVVASVLTVWMNGQRFLPPWWGDRHLWRDPVAVERAEAAATAVASALRASGAAVLYDLGDEIPHVDPRSFELSPGEVDAWLRRMAGAVRKEHPGAVVLQANEASAVFARHPFGPDNLGDLDLCGLHGYPLWGPRSIAGHHSPLASRLVPFLVRYGQAYAPVLVDEIGAYLASPQTTADHLRATLPAVAAAGATGVLAWSWTDISAPGRPFDERPSERTTGVIDGWGVPRPALAVLTSLARQVRELWAVAERPPRPVALFVPERARAPECTYLQDTTPDGLALFHAAVLCSRAHLPADVTRVPGEQHRLVICPAPGRLTERDLTTLATAVRGGATLLVSLGDPLHGFPGPTLTGVDLVDFAPGPRHARFVFDGVSYPLRWADGARAAVVAARPGTTVEARFDNGQPALTRHRVGAGEVWLLAAPLEAQLDDPEHMEAAPWHRLYRTVAQLAGATEGEPYCDAPDVELDQLVVDGQRVLVAVNHAAASVTTRLEGDRWPAGETLELGPKSAETRGERVLSPTGPSARW